MYSVKGADNWLRKVRCEYADRRETDIQHDLCRPSALSWLDSLSPCGKAERRRGIPEACREGAVVRDPGLMKTEAMP